MTLYTYNIKRYNFLLKHFSVPIYLNKYKKLLNEEANIKTDENQNVAKEAKINVFWDVAPYSLVKV
jgi:hypothetical protein